MRDVSRMCEARPGQEGRCSQVIMFVDGRQTVVATSSWELTASIVRAVLEQAR